MKLLHTATVTGADDSIRPQDLVSLTRDFPYVEWGLLLSQHNEVAPRFPSRKWLSEVVELQLPLSGHLCGRWVRDLVLNGEWSFLEAMPEPIWQRFSRLQLNFADRFHYAEDRFLSALQSQNFCYIFQSGEQHETLLKAVQLGINAVPLFDLSGGRGILPKNWPAPLPGLMCGYAGGLGPDNLDEQLARLEEIAGDAEIWVDCESRVRTPEERLDLGLVEKYLTIAGRWIAD